MHLLAGCLKCLLRAEMAPSLQHGGRWWPSEAAGLPALGGKDRLPFPVLLSAEAG